ncbi:MAG: hypothetical protein ACUZ8E_02345 [Candidatus Anammoxibacter sp.]
MTNEHEMIEQKTWQELNIKWHFTIFMNRGNRKENIYTISSGF